VIDIRNRRFLQKFNSEKIISHFLLEEERRDTGKAKRHRIQQQQSTKISTPTILCPTSMPTINSSVSPTNDE